MVQTASPVEFSWAKLAVLIVLFVGGGWAGGALGEYVAPNAPILWFPSFFMLPFAFVTAMGLWQGLVFIAMLIRLPMLLRERAQRRAAGVPAPPANDQRARQELRRRAWVMIPPAIGTCFLAGIIVALGATSFLMTVLMYTAVGLGYGLLLWWLAQKELLFFGWE